MIQLPKFGSLINEMHVKLLAQYIQTKIMKWNRTTCKEISELKGQENTTNSNTNQSAIVWLRHAMK